MFIGICLVADNEFILTKYQCRNTAVRVELPAPTVVKYTEGTYFAAPAEQDELSKHLDSSSGYTKDILAEQKQAGAEAQSQTPK